MQLYITNRDYIDMWLDNFYHMSDSMRLHTRIYCLSDLRTALYTNYNEFSFTTFLFNFDYCDWIKSIALGMTDNILNDVHAIYSVHGAILDIDGSSITLIAPSKTDKTTQSWWLLRMENTHLISDDWYFVLFGSRRSAIEGSEKNCYIDASISDVGRELPSSEGSQVRQQEPWHWQREMGG